MLPRAEPPLSADDVARRLYTPRLLPERGLPAHALIPRPGVLTNHITRKGLRRSLWWLQYVCCGLTALVTLATPHSTIVVLLGVVVRPTVVGVALLAVAFVAGAVRLIGPWGVRPRLPPAP